MSQTLNIRQEGLSALIRHSFYHAAKAINQLKPFYDAASRVYRAKLPAKMGKAGQALWDKPGTRYGGENMVVGMLRRMRRQWKEAELKSMRFTRS